jgi:hypothetical protein
MPTVLIQILSDEGQLQSESTVVTNAPIEHAEQIVAASRDAAMQLSIPIPGEAYVIEFRYADGDVGAHVDYQANKLWAQFTRAHQPSHILIRPDTKEGQLLSNQLYHTSGVIAALKAFVDAINATGGVVSSETGIMVPVAEREWSDLGDAYATACKALGVPPRTSQTPDPNDQSKPTWLVQYATTVHASSEDEALHLGELDVATGNCTARATES